MVKCWKCGGELEPEHEYCGLCGAPRTASHAHFRHVETEFFKLRGQLATGRLSDVDFQAALRGLVIQDKQGRFWMLGKESGVWYVHSGAAWQPADPYAEPAPSTGPQALPQ